jgi:outer membrane protein assembly factor BamB
MNAAMISRRCCSGEGAQRRRESVNAETAVDAATGTPHYQNQRLEDVPNVFASPVSARGRIYFPGREGTTLVVKSGPSCEVLAKNTRDDGFDASPAPVDNEIYPRGNKYLHAIAEP